jgi:hypothetical protein
MILGPPVRGLQRAAAVARRMHVGHVNAYAAYILVTMLVILILGAGLF